LWRPEKNLSEAGIQNDEEIALYCSIADGTWNWPAADCFEVARGLELEAPARGVSIF
jgi:hypothetical protein